MPRRAEHQSGATGKGCEPLVPRPEADCSFRFDLAMAADPFDALRLALMQDVLPVGLAAVDRVRKGGAGELMAAFAATDGDPVARLRAEGEPAASRVRETLDQFSPGLGNPVMRVEVRDVPPDLSTQVAAQDAPSAADPVELQERLRAIGQRLQQLEDRFQAGEETS